MIYEQNSTMEMLGHQDVIVAGSPESVQIKDIISAYKAEHQDRITQLVMGMFEDGGVLFSFLRDVHNLGVINGKRELRAKKKQKPMNNPKG